jgi:peroxiredoxin
VTLLLLTVLLAPAIVRAAPAAPGFRVRTLDGARLLDSRALIGKKVLVLRFQASYCRPCAAESAPLAAVAERYRARGVELWAIHVQDTAADARAWVAAQRATYPVALDPRLTIGNRYGFKGAPYTVVVDKKGEIAWRLRGESAPTRLPRVLDDLLTREARPSRKL